MAENTEETDQFENLSVSISVSLPLGVLRDVDNLLRAMRRQGRKHFSRSKLIGEAVESFLAAHRDPETPTAN